MLSRYSLLISDNSILKEVMHLSWRMIISDLKITSLVSCILHITIAKVCMKSLFIAIQESNIVISYQVSMVHMFYLWHIFGALGRFRAIPASFSQPCLVSKGYLCKYSCLEARWYGTAMYRIKLSSAKIFFCCESISKSELSGTEKYTNIIVFTESVSK